MKTKNTIDPHPHLSAIVQKFASQHFNPQKIGEFVMAVVKYCVRNGVYVNGSMQNIRVCKKIAQNVQSKSIRSLFYCPNISILLANMKLYDVNQIRRQNQVLGKLEQHQRVIHVKFNNIAINTHENKIMTEKTTKIIKRKQKNNKKNQNIDIINLNKNTTQVNLMIDYINTNYTAFTILSHRLNDINAFIVGIGDLVKNNKIQQEIIKTLSATLFVLEQVCDFIFRKVHKIKQNIQSYTNYVTNSLNQTQKMQQASQIELNYAKSSRSLGRTLTSRQKPLYNSKNKAKKLLQQLKQLQNKYTTISKQIIARQNKYKQYRNYIQSKDNSLFKITINYTPKTNNQNASQQVTCNQNKQLASSSNQNINYLALPNSGSSFSDNNEYASVTYRSILKKHNKFKKNSSKRISLEIITALLQSQRKQQLKKVFGDRQIKSSRFVHRPGVSIGSGQIIQNTIAKNYGNKNKKHVKIQTMESQNQENQYKLKISSFKSKQKSNFSSKSISFQQKQKSHKHQQDQEGQQLYLQQNININKSISQKQKKKILQILQNKQIGQKNARLLRKKRIYSFQVDKDSSQSIPTNRSKNKVRAQRKVPSRNNIRKGNKKYSYLYQFHSFSSQDSNKQIPKSMIHITEESHHILDKSLQKMLMIALQNKKMNKNGARSGQIIINRSSQQMPETDRNNQRYDILNKFNKKTKKGRMLHKDQQKQALHALILKSVRQIVENGNTKPAKNLVVSSKHIQGRSTRRIGALMPEHNKNKSNISTNKQQNKSQTNSVVGSKVYYLSNKRLVNSQEQQRHKRQKIKTQQNEAQSYKIPEQFKVNIQDRLTFVENFVKFYPNIQCSLHKTAKRNRILQQKSNQVRYNLMLQQFGQMPKFYVNKYVNNIDSEPQIIQTQIKRKIFKEQGQKIKFARKFILASNQLQQKQLISCGRYKQNGLASNFRPKRILFQDSDNQF